MKSIGWHLPARLIMTFYFIFLPGITALVSTRVSAGPAPLTLILDINDEDGVLLTQSIGQIFLDIQNNANEPSKLQIEWQFFTDDGQPRKQVTTRATVAAGNSTRTFCPLFALPAPGFYRVSAKATSQSGESYSVSKVLGYQPEKIVSQLNPAPDFWAFWEASLTELAAIAPECTVIPQQRSADSKTDLFKVEMKSIGGLTVRGWLEVPKKPGIYAALLRVPGYEGNMLPIDRFDDMIVFSFNPRNHGESDDSGARNYAMWVNGMESAETYFYRGLYLDCIRAVDFLASRPDVDTSRIAIWGGSQGGGLSFSTAALDPRIDLCIADIPFLCDWQKYFEITHWQEVDAWFEEHPEQTWQSVLQTLSYYDTKNLAKNITCPVIMGIGLQDDVCPPATSFATYNLINSSKEYTVYKNEGHSQPAGHYENRFHKLRKIFGLK